MRTLVTALVLCCAFNGLLEAADPPAKEPASIHPEAALDHLIQGEVDALVADFDATMKSALSKSQLQSVWSTLVSQAGAYKSHGKAEISNQKEYRVALIPMVFENAELKAKIVYDAEGKIAGLFFIPVDSKPSSQAPAPSYSKPSAYKESSVTAGSTGWALPATLSMPLGDGPFPAVVLVQGSGPHDRDETVGGVKPFRDLATGLASRKIAVLRYEKRTKEYGAKLMSDRALTVREEVVDDALAAIALLRKTPGIDPARVFVLGHSLGGMMLPEIGTLDPGVAGLIALAGPARPLEDLLVEQTRSLLDASSASEETKKTKTAEMEQIVRQIKDPAFGRDDQGAPILGAYPKYWASIRGYNSADAARSVHRPFLILQGERDYQVTMRDFALWREALAGRTDAQLKSYPKLNHLFVEGEGPSTPAEYERPGNVSESVIADIATWIVSVRKDAA